MYHSGNSELEQLEDRHHHFNQKLSELEWDYADMRMDVRQHTENLVDWLSACIFKRQVRRPKVAWSVYLPCKKSLRQNSSAMKSA